jgi:hypothetical protein
LTGDFQQIVHHRLLQTRQRIIGGRDGLTVILCLMGFFNRISRDHFRDVKKVMAQAVSPADRSCRCGETYHLHLAYIKL